MWSLDWAVEGRSGWDGVAPAGGSAGAVARYKVHRYPSLLRDGVGGMKA